MCCGVMLLLLIIYIYIYMFVGLMIDDIVKHTLECRSAEAWKAINLFLWQKIQIYELHECRVDRLHEAKDKKPSCRCIKSCTL